MITVFTPTYNRAKLLPRLYQSLKTQTNKNFEWLIVDDGSVDETENLITKYIIENRMPIRYYKQENAGKHIAINKGLDKANGRYFFIVDSDDYLTNESIQKILEWFENVDDKIAGVVGRKCYSSLDKIGSSFPKVTFISNHIKKIYIDHIKGDLAEVYRTDIMRQNKFPFFQNEKYCAEGLLWNRIAREQDSFFFDECVYIAEYQPDGLSSKSARLRHASPTYAHLYYSELLEYKKLSLKIKLRTYINLWRFSFNKPSLVNKNFRKFTLLSFISLPIGILIFLIENFLNKST
jgi:glycosyltransferase involved in cell wall biosynthesis